jgi:hypothetical protein
MTVFNVYQKYDPLTGELVRDVRSRDIVTLSVPHDQYSAGTMNFTALDSNTELLITGFMASAITAGADVYVTVGTSTILPIRLAANTPFSVATTVDAPIARAAASSTISIAAGSAGTYTAFLWGVRHPIPSKVETA